MSMAILLICRRIWISCLLIPAIALSIARCAKDSHLSLPDDGEAQLHVAFTRAGNPEDDIADARLIVTNVHGTHVLYNSRMSDSSDQDMLTLSASLKPGAVNIYLFANELASWNLDAMSSAAEIRDKAVNLTAAPQVDAAHLIPMYKEWDGVQFALDGSTTVNGAAIDFSSDAASKVERLWAKIELQSISANFADLYGIAITLDSVRALRIPVKEFLNGRTGIGAEFCHDVIPADNSNYAPTSTGFTAGPFVFFVPENIPASRDNATYIEICCHLTADPNTTFTYRLYVGNGLTSGLITDNTAHSLSDLTVSRNTHYSLTVSQIKGFGQLASAMVHVDIQPWSSASVSAAIDKNVLNLSDIATRSNRDELEAQMFHWVVNWETNHEPRYIIYDRTCTEANGGYGVSAVRSTPLTKGKEAPGGETGGSPGGGDQPNYTSWGWADKTAVSIPATCRQLLTVLAPEMLYAADGEHFNDTLKVTDWFNLYWTAQMNNNSGTAWPDADGFYRGVINIMPQATVPQPGWPTTGKYRLLVGDDNIRQRAIEIELVAVSALAQNYCVDGCVATMYTFQQQKLTAYGLGETSAVRHYQWQKKENGIDADFVDIAAATDSIYTIQPYTHNSTTTVQYRCRVYNILSERIAEFPAIDFIHLGAAAELQDIAAANSGLIPVTLNVGSSTVQFAHANLGAEFGAFNNGIPNDACDFGDLYQWGRMADNHQFVVWQKPYREALGYGSETAAAVDAASGSSLAWSSVTHQITDPSHAGKFVSGTQKDWYLPHDNNLWSGSSGAVADPCPAGWHVPTAAEWRDIFTGNAVSSPPGAATQNRWGSNLAAWQSGAAPVAGGYTVTQGVTGITASTPRLFLPAAGSRNYTDGAADNIGTNGAYWTASTADSETACYTGFLASSVSPGVAAMAKKSGLSVRCVKGRIPASAYVIDGCSSVMSTADTQLLTVQSQSGTLNGATFQWQYAVGPSNETYVNIANATGATYTVPARNVAGTGLPEETANAASDTLRFRCIVTVGGIEYSSYSFEITFIYYSAIELN